MPSLTDFINVDTKPNTSKKLDSVFDLTKPRTTNTKPKSLINTKLIDDSTKKVEEIFISSFLTGYNNLIKSVIKNGKKDFSCVPLLKNSLYALWNNAWSLGRSDAVRELSKVNIATFACPIFGTDSATIAEFTAEDQQRLEVINNVIGNQESRAQQLALEISRIPNTRENRNQIETLRTELRGLQADISDARKEATRLERKILNEPTKIQKQIKALESNRETLLKQRQKLVNSNVSTANVDDRLRALDIERQSLSNELASSKQIRRQVINAGEEVGVEKVAKDSAIKQRTPEENAFIQGRSRERALNNALNKAPTERVRPTVDPTATAKQRAAQIKAQQAFDQEETVRGAQDALRKSFLQQERNTARIQKEQRINLVNTPYDQIYLRDRIDNISTVRSNAFNAQIKQQVGRYLQETQGGRSTQEAEKRLIDNLTGQSFINGRIRTINEIFSTNNVPAKSQSRTPRSIDVLEADRNEIQGQLFELTYMPGPEDDPTQMGSLPAAQDRLRNLRRLDRLGRLTPDQQQQIPQVEQQIQTYLDTRNMLQNQLKDINRELKAAREGKGFNTRDPILDRTITLTDAQKRALGISQDEVTLRYLDNLKSNTLKYNQADPSIVNPIRRIAVTEVNLAYNLGRIEKFREEQTRTGKKICIRWRNDNEQGTGVCPFCRERDGVVIELDAVTFDLNSSDLRNKRNVNDARNQFGIPAHPNCRCYWEIAPCSNVRVPGGQSPERIAPSERRNILQQLADGLRTNTAKWVIGSVGSLSIAAAYGALASMYREYRPAQEIIEAGAREVLGQEQVVPTPVRDVVEETIRTDGELPLPLIQRPTAPPEQTDIRNQFLDRSGQLLRDRGITDNITARNEEISNSLDNYNALSMALDSLANSLNPEQLDTIRRNINEILSSEDENAPERATALVNELSQTLNDIDNLTYYGELARDTASSDLYNAINTLNSARNTIVSEILSNEEYGDLYRRYRGIESPLVDITTQIPDYFELNRNTISLSDVTRNLETTGLSNINYLKSIKQELSELTYRLNAESSNGDDFIQGRVNNAFDAVSALRSNRAITRPAIRQISDVGRSIQQLSNQLDGVTTIRKSGDGLTYTYFVNELQRLSEIVARAKVRFSQDPNVLAGELPILSRYVLDRRQYNRIIRAQQNEISTAVSIYNELSEYEQEIFSLINRLEATPKLRTIDRLPPGTTREEYLTSVVNEITELKATRNRTEAQEARLEELLLEQVRVLRAEFKNTSHLGTLAEFKRPLVKKQIVNQEGEKQTVWVKPSTLYKSSVYREGNDFRHDIHFRGKNIAYALVKNRDNHYFLEAVEVSPNFRGQGLATRLVQEVQKTYKNKPIKLLARPYKNSDLDRKQLVSFYQKQGFRPISSKVYKNGILMEFDGKKSRK